MNDYTVTIRTIDGEVADRAGQPSLAVDHHLAGRAAIDIEVLSGGHLLHLAIAGCLFNDIMREAPVRGVSIDSLAVTAGGGFDDQGSTGVRYEIEVRSPGDRSEVERLVADMEADATIPQALRAGAPVERAALRIRD